MNSYSYDYRAAPPSQLRMGDAAGEANVGVTLPTAVWVGIFGTPILLLTVYMLTRNVEWGKKKERNTT